MHPDVASSAATQATIKRTDAARASVDPSSISPRFGRCSTRSARPRPLLLFFRSLSRCRFSSELMLRSSDRTLPALGTLRVKGLSISWVGDSRTARASGRLSASKRSSQSNLGAAATTRRGGCGSSSSRSLTRLFPPSRASTEVHRRRSFHIDGRCCYLAMKSPPPNVGSFSRTP